MKRRVEKMQYKESGVLSPNKWMLHPERRELALAGRFYDIIPVNAHFAPSLTCNFTCPSCTYGGSKEDYRNKLKRGEHIPKDKIITPLDNMKLIVDRVGEAGIKRIIFTGGGEPLINPYTLDGMQYAKESGLSTALFTNGSLLNKEKADKLLDINPAFVRISLNAGSEEIHRLFHGLKRPYFNKVVENIRYLAKERQRINSSTEVSIGVITSPLNFSEIVDIAEVVNEIYMSSPEGGIDNLNYRPTVNYGGHKKQINKVAEEGMKYVDEHFPEFSQSYRDFFYTEKQFPKEVFERAIRLVEKSKEILEDKVNVNIPAQKFKDLTDQDIKCPYKECLAFPWVVKIGPDGSVYHCVELGIDEKYVIGNLLEQNFQEIWESEKRKKAIEKVNGNGSLESVCGKGCMMHDLNRAFSQIKNYPEKRDSLRKIAEDYHKEIMQKIADKEVDEEFLNSI